MSGLPFAALVLCLCITAGQSQQFTIFVEHSQLSVTVGRDALFSVRPSGNVVAGSWIFNGKTVAQWIGQTVSVDKAYTSRAELFTSNGSLLLKSVTTSDSGEYRVSMVPPSGTQTSATFTLRVFGESQQFTITVEHSQINVIVGGDAFFSVRPSSNVSSGGWTVNGTLVVRWIDQTVSFANDYTSRAELFLHDNSLLLKSVNVRDSGEYHVNMVSVSGSQSSATITLRVIGESQPFTIHVEHSQINATVRGNALFSVRPSVVVNSGSWIFNGKTIAQWIDQFASFDNVCRSRAELFTSNGSFLLKSVNMSDSGEYRVNMVPSSGSQFSATITLRVIGQSQQFTIFVEHSQINVTVGRNALFSVRPSDNVVAGSWIFNGRTVAQWIDQTVSVNNVYRSRAELFTSNGSLLLKSVNMSDSGRYRVNMVPASGSQTSATVTLRVIEPVTGVTVVTNDSTPLENLDTIALSCDASGSVQTRRWFKDNQPIRENSRIFTSSDKAKLIIISVNRNDAGTYKCIASNPFSSGSGETYFQVYYGPEMIRIVPERPVLSNMVSNLTLTCFALSVPWGIYAWYNGNNLLHTGQELTLVSVSSVNVGSYTCRVTNGVTNRNSNLTVHVTAQAPKAVDNITLTPGAIVGIVLGLLGVGLIGGASGWFIARKTGGIKNAPQSQYETAIDSGRKSTSDTKTANAPRTYENFRSNEQGTSNNAQDESSIYMELNLGERSVYSDLKR
ncbi:cell adhesion molecule CEACAM3-like [Mobula birostris]|uniref:cell adhesion molecule CEACAM3-like n=1 Tax=Mobula birostris TaxID=1983395 RepID=UPI003B281DAC